MTTQTYQTNNGTTQLRPVMTKDEYQEMVFGDESLGFCLHCGDVADGVEPDGRRYTCQACGQQKVYGLEELLLMGLLRLTDAD